MLLRRLAVSVLLLFGSSSAVVVEAQSVRLTDFDSLRYIASHGDLIQAFGADAAKGRSHYEQYGVKEGRTITFDPNRYMASHPDLILAFAGSEEKATRHYIEWGYREGRSTTAFDGLAYIASYADLITAFSTDSAKATRHYIDWGYKEGRRITFDPLAYIASYADLMAAFATDAIAGAKHYIQWGFKEGRRILFDALAYIARYADIQAAFGGDTVAATKHYIQWGSKEGRSVPALPPPDSGPFASADLRIGFTPFTYEFDLPSGKTFVNYKMGAFKRSSEFLSTVTYKISDYGFFDISAKGLHKGCSVSECGAEYADPGPWAPISTSLAADINKDGHEDFFLFDFLIGERGPQPDPLIHAFLNDGRGHFSLSTSLVFDEGRVCSSQGGIGPQAVAVKSRDSKCGYSVGPLRHALLADFNNDGMTDVYAYFVLYLSENGRLKNKTLTHLPKYFRESYMAAVFTHDHYAADIDADGDIDIFIPTIQTTENGWFGDGTKIQGCDGCVATMPWTVLVNDGFGNFKLNQNFPLLGVGLDHPLLASYKSVASQSRGILWGGEREKLWVTATAIADFDKDGHGDVMVGWFNPRATNVWGLGGNSAGAVYLNNGKNDWTKRNPIVLPASPYAENGNGNDAEVMDFNSDGWPDIILASTRFEPYYQGRIIQFFENDRNGSFRDVTSERNLNVARYAMGAGSPRLNGEGLLSLRDYDQDGDIDIIDSTAFTYVLLNDGAGKFVLAGHEMFPYVDGATPTYHPVNVNKSGKLDFIGSSMRCLEDTCISSHYQVIN